MSPDHEDLADEQEELVERMEHESERVGENAESAQSKFDQAHSDEMVPEPLGDEDPARREGERLGEGEEPVTAAPANIDDEAREGEEKSGDDLASAAGPSGDETDEDAEKPDDDDEDDESGDHDDRGNEPG
jgi:hypothetical protein